MDSPKVDEGRRDVLGAKGVVIVFIAIDYDKIFCLF